MFTYLLDNIGQVYTLLLQHIELTVIAVGLAIFFGVPLGIWISFVRPARQPVLGFTNVMQAIPSMALLGFFIPFMGIGKIPAILAVFLYSLLPIVKNTYTGMQQLDSGLVEAAKALGMNRWQVLFYVSMPLVLPLIMAGIRIAAVTAVGLMTIAAYIGAGGLGYLVFTGISAVNNGMIVAGALPAALLALGIDWMLGLVERLVTPASLQFQGQSIPKGFWKRQRWRKGLLTVITAVLCIAFGQNYYAQYIASQGTIVIGSKFYSEQILLGNMLSELIEHETRLKTVKKLGLGASSVVIGAMEKGEVDLYVDYTGSLYVDILHHKPINNPEKVYDVAKEEMAQRYHLTLLPTYQFNNTFALAVTPKTAQAYHLKTLSDLQKADRQLISGTTLEFLNRQDGVPGVQDYYGFHFKEAKAVPGGNRYLAIHDGAVQVIDAFSTDALVKKFNLVVLEDDRHFFPPYYAVPVVRTEALKEHPELAAVIEKLRPFLTDDVMRELNYKIDEQGQSPKEVAHEFLKSHGLLGA